VKALTLTKGVLVCSVLGATLFIAGCSQPAKYILVTDRNDVNFADGDRFYICLQPEEAQRVRGMLTLRTKSSVKEYYKTRSGGPDALEEILYDIISAHYSAAQGRMDTQGDSLPPYLRLLLKADLARENKRQRTDPGHLVQMYQAAFDDPGCGLNRDLIKLRIRQVRYGR